jgi:hypothetical protein
LITEKKFPFSVFSAFFEVSVFRFPQKRKRNISVFRFPFRFFFNSIPLNPGGQVELFPQFPMNRRNYFPNSQLTGGIISPIPNRQAELFPQFPMNRLNYFPNSQ